MGEKGGADTLLSAAVASSPSAPKGKQHGHRPDAAGVLTAAKVAAAEPACGVGAGSAVRVFLSSPPPSGGWSRPPGAQGLRPEGRAEP